MSTHRLFVAIPIPQPLKAYILEHGNTFAAPGLRLTLPENLHLTGIFLGNVDADQIPDIEDELADIASRHHCFTLKPRIIEAGPNARRPKVLWTLMWESQPFLNLVKDFRTELNRFAQHPDERKPKPHITLGRYKKNYQPPRPLRPVETIDGPEMEVTQIELWESKLKKSGAEYGSMGEWGLL